MEEDKDEALTDELRTIFKFRLNERRADTVRDILIIFGMLLAFICGMSVIGGVQFIICRSKDESISIYECLIPYSAPQKVHEKKRRASGN